jgi:hypothetical protein
MILFNMASEAKDIDSESLPEANKRLIKAAVQEAAIDAILSHQWLGLPMVQWQHGNFVLVPADRLEGYGHEPLTSHLGLWMPTRRLPRHGHLLLSD